MGEEKRIDDDLLLEALSAFAHTLAGRFEVSEVLYRLAENVVAVLRVAGAGVSVVDDHGRLRPVTAINELTAQLENVEEAGQQGPCVDSFRRGEVIRVPRPADRADECPARSGDAKGYGDEAARGRARRASG